MRDVGRNKRSALRPPGGFEPIDLETAAKRRNKAIAPYNCFLERSSSLRFSGVLPLP
jgi:hypothetical protein